ncbi:MAG: dienelactone hydrolase family protein [Armatimonadota bacterium]
MASHRLRLLLIAACSILIAAPVLADTQESADWDTLRSAYDYDATADLDAQVSDVSTVGSMIVERMSFLGDDDERIPALLMRPAGVERPPCALVLHGLGGDKSQARVIAALLIPHGIAVMAIDAALHGDRREQGVELWDAGPALGEREGPLMRTVVDNRRAIDYIVSRDDIDGDRVVLVGLSMGAILGSVVAAVDDRVDAAALIVGGGDWEKILSTSDHPMAARFREAGIIDGSALAPVDPVNFIGKISPRPVLLINGTEDAIIPRAAAEALHEAAREPVQTVWFEGGHVGLTPDVIFGFVDWTAQQFAEDETDPD